VSDGAIITTDGPPGVLAHHLAALRARGLTDETIKAAGITSEYSKDRLATLLKWKRPWKTLAPAILIPFYAADGSNGYCRVRPDTPRKDANGKAIKYESPRGEPNRAYLPPGVAAYLTDPAQELAITEGEFKSLALTQELLPTIGLVGVFGWKEKDCQRLLPDLERVAWQGRRVYLIPDSDFTMNENVSNAMAWLAKHLKDRGAIVKLVRLPDGPDGAKMGADDYIASKGAGAKREVRALLDAAEDPPAIAPETAKRAAVALDPADEARRFLESGKYDGCDRLRNWRGLFMLWTKGSYSEVPPAEVRAQLNNHLDRGYHHLTSGITTNVLDQLKARALLSYGYMPPCWLEPVNDWQPADVVVARNGILHLPSLAMLPATPRFFTTAALDCDYQADVPTPEAWLDFLNQIWADDAESIATLQEWFGLCLVADTRFQKMLLLVGPKRSGKGTIARILRAVVGPQNCAGPTLASLAQNFGLMPLVGKTVAIFSDARLSGRTDTAVVTERLLSITGEDELTIDVKHRDPVTVKLLTRLMMMTNELPQLGDSSGALSGRMIVLKMVRSFYNREDIDLTGKLLMERPGILAWSIQGWKRLRTRGCFVQPASGEALREQMDDLASPVGEFLKERCIVGSGNRTAITSIYAAWSGWCIGKGQKPGTEQSFGRNLAAAAPGVRVIRPREGDTRYRAYEGVGLLSDEGAAGF
jgi:putative DNA primase/helicase